MYMEDVPGCSSLDNLNLGNILFGGRIPYCAGIFYKNSDERFVGLFFSFHQVSFEGSFEETKHLICLLGYTVDVNDPAVRLNGNA